MNNHKVFVYGSLKKGLYNHRLLEDAKFIGVAYTDAEFALMSYSFPIMVPGTQSVSGELYEVTDEQLQKLDALESEGNMYDRKAICINLVNPDNPDKISGAVEAQAYIGNYDFWKGRAPMEYWTKCNDYGELEWSC